jgi:hypothetical protein
LGRLRSESPFRLKLALEIGIQRPLDTPAVLAGRGFSDERLADLQAKGLGVSAMARELRVSREAIYKRRRAQETVGGSRSN